MPREPETLMERVLVSMYEDGPGSTAQIATRLDVSVDAVESAMQEAVERGFVKKGDGSDTAPIEQEGNT